MAFELTSTAFVQGEPIPQQYTGDGKNSSPPLKWNEPPAGTQSLALICEDPDAPRGTFTHWIAFNMPANSRELKDGLPREATLADGTTQIANDFGKVGYGGPAPPPGKPHRYYFRLYALDQKLDLKPNAGKDQVASAIQAHTIAKAELMGIYKR